MFVEKFCVFCGKKPEKKNMEHVIPRWLITLTGDPNRKINLGIKWDEEGNPVRTFPFQAFKVPACTACNEEHGKLEAKAKYICINILKNKSISVFELHTFLDWLDKVRLGLWLAFHYLDKNMFGVKPNFHIKKRLSTSDRLLFIYKSNTATKGINFTATNTPCFHHMPSCFSLRINNYFFFNVSYPFLLARRLGFPFPEKMYETESGKTEVDLKESRQRIMKPVIRWPFHKNCVELYQPLFKNIGTQDQMRELYETQYVQDNSLSFESNIGWPHWSNGGKVSQFPKDSGENWLNLREEDHEFLNKKLMHQTLDFQNRLFDLTSYDKLTKEKQRYFKSYCKKLKSVNSLLMKK